MRLHLGLDGWTRNIRVKQFEGLGLRILTAEPSRDKLESAHFDPKGSKYPIIVYLPR